MAQPGTATDLQVSPGVYFDFLARFPNPQSVGVTALGLGPPSGISSFQFLFQPSSANHTHCGKTQSCFKSLQTSIYPYFMEVFLNRNTILREVGYFKDNIHIRQLCICSTIPGKIRRMWVGFPWASPT